MNPRPIPRNLKFPFQPTEIPKHWFGNSVLATHMANSLNLLFPKGERYFIRAVREFSKEIKDPELKSAVNAFAAQEFQHGREHEHFFEVLKQQGFEVDSFLNAYERFAFGFVERIQTPTMRLATTAAFEHYTAQFAEAFLQQKFLNDSPGVMRDLFQWHACEEIEHKAVTYDVLQLVAPGYFTRIFGLLTATTLLTILWTRGAYTLLKQDPEATFKRILAEIKRGSKENHFSHYPVGRAFFSYWRPGFHPNQNSIPKQVEEKLKEITSKYSAA